MRKKAKFLAMVMLIASFVLVLGSCDLLNKVLNTPPVANAGSDQTVAVGTQVTLNGSGSHDADGNSLTFTWTVNSQPPASTINNSKINGAGQSIAYFTPDVAGLYLMQLKVSDGQADATATVQITATGSGGGALTAPTGLTVGSPTPNSLDVSWNYVAAATGYRVFRDMTSGGSFSTQVYDGANQYFTDTPLQPSTRYYYKVLAYNATGESPLSLPQFQTTLMTGQTGAPATPQNLTVANPTGYTLDISWNASTNATSYMLYKDTSASGSFTMMIYSGPGTSFTDSGLSPGTMYYYKVKASNGSGTSSFSVAASGTTTSTASVPSTPQGLNVGGATSSTLTLSWQSSAGATSYKVYRLENSSGISTGDYAQIATGITQTTYVDSGLSISSTFHYKVSAVNSAGESPLSGFAQGATTQSSAQQAPGVPTGVTVGGATTNSLTVSWSAVTGATSYLVYRNMVPSIPTSPIATVNSGTTYTNIGLSPQTTYYYWVVAQNTYGQSPFSTFATGTTIAQVVNYPPTVPFNPTPANGASGVNPSSVTLSWSASSDPEGGSVWYDVYVGQGYPSSLVASNTPMTTIMPGYQAYGTNYSWKVVARDNAGNTTESPVWSYTTAASQTQPPVIDYANTYATPTSLTAGSGTTVYLYGSAYDPDGGSVSYNWSFGYKPSNSYAVIVNQYSPNADFVPDVEGQYQVVLTVTDGSMMTASASFWISVNPSTQGGLIYGVR